MVKRYDELEKGDKIWFHGYKAFIRDIKESGVVADKRNVFHFGEKIISLNIGFEPSDDHIERTIYNENCFGYGGVASLTMTIRED